MHKLREQQPENAVSRKKLFKAANLAVIDSVPADSFRDRSLGALLGSMIADSCGSYLGLLD